MAYERLGSGFGVDTRGLKSFIQATRRASPLAARGIRTSLRVGGEAVAEEARRLAGAHSTTIPATVKVRTAGAAVSVIAGQGVPLAALYELGNAGTSRTQSEQAGTFRHPVFGDRENWAVQNRWPFLRPAAQTKSIEVEEAVMKVADEIADVLAGNLGDL